MSGLSREVSFQGLCYAVRFTLIAVALLIWAFVIVEAELPKAKVVS